MKRLVLGLMVWAAVVTGVFYITGAPQSPVTPQQPDRQDAAQELRALHQQIVNDTILY